MKQDGDRYETGLRVNIQQIENDKKIINRA